MRVIFEGFTITEPLNTHGGYTYLSHRAYLDR